MLKVVALAVVFLGRLIVGLTNHSPHPISGSDAVQICLEAKGGPLAGASYSRKVGVMVTALIWIGTS